MSPGDQRLPLTQGLTRDALTSPVILDFHDRIKNGLAWHNMCSRNIITMACSITQSGEAKILAAKELFKYWVFCLSKIYKQRVLTPGHQGWNDLHSLCRIGMEYYLLNDNNNDNNNNNNDDNNNNNNDDNDNNNNNDDVIIIIIMIITTIMIIMMMPRDVSSQMWHSLQ